MTWTTGKIFPTFFGSRSKMESVPECDQPTLLIMCNSELVFITFIRLQSVHSSLRDVMLVWGGGGVIQQWNFNLSTGRDKHTILLMDRS